MRRIATAAMHRRFRDAEGPRGLERPSHSSIVAAGHANGRLVRTVRERRAATLTVSIADRAFANLSPNQTAAATASSLRANRFAF